MKISVTASKRDDILREQAEYNDLMTKQNAVHDQQYAKYRFADDYNLAEIENIIRSRIPGLRQLGVKIDIDNWYGTRGGVRIRFNKENRDLPAESLRWDWEVGLDSSGNITKDSSSWSGMSVTTPEQLADLKKSVDVLSKLIEIDWEPILKQCAEGRPDYSDYVSVRELRSRDSEFNQQLKLAAIEDLIGAPTWIRGKTYDESRWNHGDKWYMIHNQTEKFFTVSTISVYSVDTYKKQIESDANDYTQENLEKQLESAASYTERVKKDKLIPCIYNEIETMDMHGNITFQNLPQEDTKASTLVSSELVTL